MASMNSHFKVRNINGTSGERYANSGSKTGPSWLKVWRDGTGSARATCCVLQCGKDAEVGAHVMKVDGRSSNEWWLAPFCKEHNNTHNTDEMFVDSRVTLISVRDR